jgi:hypothetical protein
MAASLEAVPGGGDLKSNLSRLLLGPTSQGERMSALRAFDQAPDPGETMPTGRGVWESSIRTGVLIQAWYAPAAQLGEELAKRLDSLAAAQRLDVTSFLSRGAERVGVLEPDDAPFDYGDSDEVIDLGEMSFSLEDLLTVSDEASEETTDAIVGRPSPWNIDWNAPSVTDTPDTSDDNDDPFALPAAKPKPESHLVLNDDPFA